jgi:hypothetical protein
MENNKFKIPDLSKIDIKDIDINKIKDQLLENKERVVQVALGVLAFFMIVSMWAGSQKEIGKFKKQINTMQSKSGIIGEYKKSQSAYDAFLKNLPPSLSEGQIINLVTDLADKNKIKILTFVPVTAREGRKNYQETKIQFSLQAKGYKDMVRLIADVEKSKNLLQVRTCAVQGASANPGIEQAADQKTEQKYLDFRIEVASLEVKE